MYNFLVRDRKNGYQQGLISSKTLTYIVDNPANPTVRSAERSSIIPHSWNQTEFLIDSNSKVYSLLTESASHTDFKL